MEKYNNKEAIFPIKWKEWDELDMNITMFFNVKFFEDFGVFRKDDIYHCLTVFYSDGIMETTDEEGNILLTQRFKCVPCE